tara:strand:- start:381 stop:1907 length:1527 start_codon:yes stop_codon:yes gene_type:complete
MLLSSLLSGVLYFLSFPPFGFWFLIIPALWFFFLSVLRSKKSFLLGFIFGSLSYGVILFGIQSIGYEAWVPLTILMGLMYGVFAKAISYLGSKADNNFLVLLAVISSFDLVRAYFPFGGFPWGYPSTVLIDFIQQPFKIFGPIGFSLVIQAIVLSLVLNFMASDKKQKYDRESFLIFRNILVFLLIMSFVYEFRFAEEARKGDVERGDIEISIIQGNSPCPGAKNRCENERQRIYESHLNLTKSLSKEQLFQDPEERIKPRLIVWPESSSGFGNDPGISSKTLDEISQEVKRLNTSFLIGGDRPVDSSYFENYGIFIDENGKIAGEYLKQHPVPFGEYIPFRKYLEWIPPLSLVPRDMIRGNGQEIFSIGKNNIKISSVISFEGSFERYIRRSVQEGAELIVILTNQASYGESGMSDQFILMSRANAVSNHRDIVHAAITGKSAFISGFDGKVYSSTELFTDAVSTRRLIAHNNSTPYSLWGNYLNYLIIVLGLFSFLYFRFVNRQTS